MSRGHQTRHLPVWIALAATLARPVAAQEGPLRLTLDEALARAEQNSLHVAELQARVEVAAAVEAGRDAASRPALVFLGGYTRTNHVDEYTLPLQPFNPLYPDVPTTTAPAPIFSGRSIPAAGRRRSGVPQAPSARRPDSTWRPPGWTRGSKRRGRSGHW